jgi:hypothetical protein
MLKSFNTPVECQFEVATYFAVISPKSLCVVSLILSYSSLHFKHLELVVAPLMKGVHLCLLMEPGRHAELRRLRN